MTYTCNSSTRVTGRSRQGQPGLHSKVKASLSYMLRLCVSVNKREMPSWQVCNAPSSQARTISLLLVSVDGKHMLWHFLPTANAPSGHSFFIPCPQATGSLFLRVIIMSQKVLPAKENAVPEAGEGRPEVFIDPKTPSRFPFYFFSKANWWFFQVSHSQSTAGFAVCFLQGEEQASALLWGKKRLPPCLSVCDTG